MKVYECENGHLAFDFYVGMECLECDSETFQRVTDVERLKGAAEWYKADGDKERKHMCADAVLLLLAESADPTITEWWEKFGGGWYA